MTLDCENNHFEWVRAGHDPAIMYDLNSDTFAELNGPGIALGIDGDWVYVNHEHRDISGAKIIFLGTDGVWEVRNRRGEMLGKEPIYDAIRKHSASSAEQILFAIFETLETFIDGAKIEDDITSVVIKSAKSDLEVPQQDFRRNGARS